ncbi:RbsD/FucU family protein [Bifidobacterium leontopitheci]|uniref:Fucose isomerase n=1 Tax=Bifidobacterium leontopitheci TaxID=2650774 RepID=A0A6I1GSA2_9BIFI|nr:RbsD/FucU domain-containing protein [Bifidobacterium leontopitheci]KAB7791068.1 fucose isomerase [Bifidobacterium leontopitheci]
MLLGIPPIVSPLLLKTLSEMGHGDRLVIADGNFPAESVGRDAIVIRCDGHGVPELLDAILRLVPLDQYVDKPVTLMDVVPGDPVATPIWDEYRDIIARRDPRLNAAAGDRRPGPAGEGPSGPDDLIGKVSRFDFYDLAKSAYAVIATSESAQYANVMLQKGVVLQ